MTGEQPHAVQIIDSVVQRHVDEAAFLYATRVSIVARPSISLRDLRGLDDRLRAHLDGVSVAGEHAWPACRDALEARSAGAVFTAAIRAIEDKAQLWLDGLFELLEASPETRAGLLSAFGWLEPKLLQGIVASLIVSQDPFRRRVGIAACAMHRVDPGIVSARRLQDPSAGVRARVLRTAGEVGCLEAVPACAVAIRDDDLECGFWSAWSSALLGNRGAALEVLTDTGLAEGWHRRRAFRLALQALSRDATHGVLQQLAKDPGHSRWLIQGSGIAGDSAYVPWLIKQMGNDQNARLAGEAFSLIAGADLPASKLNRTPPENFESGPNDDPDDPNVDMDPDDGLPWPDPQKVEGWWAANGSRFHKGTRYFMGAPVTREHCIDVLKNGYQRQRILAAHYLCLLEPGTPLFNTSAPAWRQQRLLAKMT
jgi:uncharacterized protein (TIGR02270 family)